MSTAKGRITTQKVDKSEFLDLIEFDLKFDIQGSAYPASEAPPLLTLEELETANKRGDELYWIIASNGSRAGFYWTEKQNDALFLSALIISTNFKNKGIGRQVLHWVDESATKFGLSRCALTVSPLNLPAVHLYLSHGYRAVRCESNYFGTSAPNRFRIILEKEIISPLEINVSESLDVMCSDYLKLIEVTKNGYLGVSLLRSEDGATMETYINFKRRRVAV